MDAFCDPRMVTLDAESWGVLHRLYGAARMLGVDTLGVPGMTPAALVEHMGRPAPGRGEAVLRELELRELVAAEGCAVRVCIGWPLPAAVVPAVPTEAPGAAEARGAVEEPAAGRAERTARKTIGTRLRRLALGDVAARLAWVETPEGRAWVESLGVSIEVARSVARRDATGRFAVTSDGDVKTSHGDANGGDTVTSDVTTAGDVTVTSSALPHTPSQREKTQRKEEREDSTDSQRTVTSAGGDTVTSAIVVATQHGDVNPTVTSPSGAVAPLSLVPPTPAKTDPVEEVFAHWRKATGKTDRTVLDGPRRRLIAKALKAYPLADLRRSIDGYAASPWHQGQNDRGRSYDGLDLILRDAEHIEKGWELLEAHGASTPAEAGVSADPWDAGLKDLAVLTRARAAQQQEAVSHG